MLKIYLLPLLFLFACVSKTYQNQDKHVCGGKSSLDKKIYKPKDKLYTDVPHLIYLPGGMFPNDKPADSPHLYTSHYGSISLGPLFVSQHEITNSQYAYFLNAINETSSSEEQGKVLMKK